MRLKPGFAFLAAIIFLLGCKNPIRKAKVAPAPVPIADSCEVLTPAEISAVLAIPVGPGSHTLIGSKILCDWSETGVSGDDAERLALHFLSIDAFKGEKIAANGIQVTPAPGIGDDAIYVTTRLDLSLLLRKGNTAIGFSLVNQNMSPDEIMTKEKALGLAAAARL
jgi:hypothetical protein